VTYEFSGSARGDRQLQALADATLDFVGGTGSPRMSGTRPG
jgi:hypothetical protein